MIDPVDPPRLSGDDFTLLRNPPVTLPEDLTADSAFLELLLIDLKKLERNLNQADHPHSCNYWETIIGDGCTCRLSDSRKLVRDMAQKITEGWKS